MSSILSDDVPIIPEPTTKEYLNERQRVDYREHREKFLEWLFTLGKRPEYGEGYSHAVVKNTAYRTDLFYRAVWDEDGYTTVITHDHADRYVRHLAAKDASNSSKSKDLKAIKRLLKWRTHEKGEEEWEPSIAFYDRTGSSQPRDFLTKAERSKIREAALNYGSIPAYDSVTPGERSRWKRYLSMRFSKPVSEVTAADWERANGWKIPSLVWTSLDVGLRPIEVERAVTSWVDVENGVLRIPRAESSKNRDNWIVGLREQTANALRRWIEERQNYSMYDGTEALWLTREENPYGSHSLKYVLGRLCEDAGISVGNRQLSWYSIRHSVGTYITREEGLAAAQAQLRHKSEQTTMRYDQAPVEDRRDALDRMG